MEVTEASLEAIKAEQPTTTQPWAIGGLLYLVAIGVFISPIRLIVSFWQTFVPIFSDGRWDDITTIGNEALFGLVVFEIIGNLVLIVCACYLIHLFVKKKANFPHWYLGISIGAFTFIGIDFYIVSQIFPTAELANEEIIRNLAPAVLSTLIWSPYLLLSERARHTFIQ